MFEKLARRVEPLVRRMVLARLLARCHVKMKSWHALGTLPRKERWNINHAGTQARWHVNHAGTQTNWHLYHVGTQARVTRDLANSENDPVFKNPSS